MKSACKTIDNQYILYDVNLTGQVSPDNFDISTLQRQGMLMGESEGRGSTYYCQKGDQQWVLRHYRRGGMMRHFSHDRYFWWGLEQTRAWREWHILAQLFDEGFPVPRPVAARVCKEWLWYRADLITQRITQAYTLNQCLQEGYVTDETWLAIGQVLRRLHDRGVHHADLNAHNILINQHGGVFVIDFDRASLRKPQAYWQKGNLVRLQRSLNKLQQLHAPFHYEDGMWAVMLRGYGHQ